MNENFQRRQDNSILKVTYWHYCFNLWRFCSVNNWIWSWRWYYFSGIWLHLFVCQWFSRQNHQTLGQIHWSSVEKSHWPWGSGVCSRFRLSTSIRQSSFGTTTLVFCWEHSLVTANLFIQLRLTQPICLPVVHGIRLSRFGTRTRSVEKSSRPCWGGCISRFWPQLFACQWFVW